MKKALLVDKDQTLGDKVTHKEDRFSLYPGAEGFLGLQASQRQVYVVSTAPEVRLRVHLAPVAAHLSGFLGTEKVDGGPTRYLTEGSGADYDNMQRGATLGGGVSIKILT